MRQAVIVATARTPACKAYRGAFNGTQAQALAGHGIRHAVGRAGIAPEEVDDVVMGCALQQGGGNGGAGCDRWAPTATGPSRGATRARWASAPSMPCRSCFACTN